MLAEIPRIYEVGTTTPDGLYLTFQIYPDDIGICQIIGAGVRLNSKQFSELEAEGWVCVGERELPVRESNHSRVYMSYILSNAQ